MISAYLDRFEGQLAVLLLGDEMRPVNFPRDYLPADVSEGDYISIDISLDEEANEEAAQEALKLLKE